MVLSFSEFNALYESTYNQIDNNSEYSNGIEIMESLLTVMQEKGTLTETEIVTFLDTVLENTDWELNTEVYESYAEWLNDWSQFIDEGINESEDELLFALTNRGQDLLEGIKDSVKSVGLKAGGLVGKVKDSASKAGTAIKGGLGKQVAAAKGLPAAGSEIWKASSKTKKAGIVGAGALAAAGLGYGAYKGIKALRARSAAKKAAKAAETK